MKYLRQFCVIVFITFIAEFMKYIIPLPIPAGIYGLVLMLLALCLGVLKLEHVKDAGNFLIEIMPVMFIPAAVGLMASYFAFKSVLIQVVLVILITTVVVMVASGKVTQCIIRLEKRKKQ